MSYVKGLQLANRSIFLEMGSFLTELWRDAATPGLKVEPYRFAKPDEFVSKLLDDRAQVSYLEQAARLFRRAASPAITPEERGEIILGANIALSAYEQQRAQKLLELVTYRPVRWIMMISWRALYYAIRRKPFLHFQIYSRPRDEVSWPVRFMENRWAGFYSRRVLSVQIPDCVIRMGEPLPPPPGVNLADLRRPLQDPEVRELVETFMGSADPPDVPGVRNWLSYDERMRFISGYFLTYRGYTKLFGPPYEKEHFCQKLYHEIWEALSPDNAESDGNDEWGDPPVGARRFRLSPLIDPETNVLASKSVRHLAVPR